MAPKQTPPTKRPREEEEEGSPTEQPPPVLPPLSFDDIRELNAPTLASTGGLPLTWSDIDELPSNDDPKKKKSVDDWLAEYNNTHNNQPLEWASPTDCVATFLFAAALLEDQSVTLSQFQQMLSKQLQRKLPKTLSQRLKGEAKPVLWKYSVLTHERVADQ